MHQNEHSKISSPTAQIRSAVDVGSEQPSIRNADNIYQLIVKVFVLGPVVAHFEHERWNRKRHSKPHLLSACRDMAHA